MILVGFAFLVIVARNPRRPTLENMSDEHNCDLREPAGARHLINRSILAAFISSRSGDTFDTSTAVLCTRLLSAANLLHTGSGSHCD